MSDLVCLSLDLQPFVMQVSDCGQGLQLIESCLEFVVFDPGLSRMRLHRLSCIGWGGVGECRGGRGNLALFTG